MAGCLLLFEEPSPDDSLAATLRVACGGPVLALAEAGSGGQLLYEVELPEVEGTERMAFDPHEYRIHFHKPRGIYTFDFESRHLHFDPTSGGPSRLVRSCRPAKPGSRGPSPAAVAKPAAPQGSLRELPRAPANGSRSDCGMWDGDKYLRAGKDGIWKVRGDKIRPADRDSSRQVYQESQVPPEYYTYYAAAAAGWSEEYGWWPPAC